MGVGVDCKFVHRVWDRNSKTPGKRSTTPPPFPRRHRICLDLEREEVGMLVAPDAIKPMTALLAVPWKAAIESPHDVLPAMSFNAEASLR